MTDEERRCEHCGNVPPNPFVIKGWSSEGEDRLQILRTFCDGHHWRMWVAVQAKLQPRPVAIAAGRDADSSPTTRSPVMPAAESEDTGTVRDDDKGPGLEAVPGSASARRAQP